MEGCHSRNYETIGGDMSKSQVSIVKTGSRPDYDAVLAAVRKSIDLIGGLDDVVKSGQMVLINPSWVATPADKETGTCTWPEVSRAVADVVKAAGARPIIAESSAVGVDCEKVIKESGHAELRDLGYEVINLKEDKTVKMPVPGGGLIFDPMPVWETVARADVIITVPVLKTHDQTEMTCSIKKLKGLLPDKTKRAFHQQGLYDAVIDLMAAVKPSLTIIDAIICQEGMAPIYGDPVEMDLVLASRDLVAADTICGLIIGYQPDDLKLSVNAAQRGLGVMDPAAIEVVGESVESVQRRFVRASEAAPKVTVNGFKLVFGEETCTGCRNTVYSVLHQLDGEGNLDYLEKIAMLTGGAELPAEGPANGVVTVGDKCTPKDRRGDRHAKGCPPNSIDVVQAILGDRGKAKRTYADDPDSD